MSFGKKLQIGFAVALFALLWGGILGIGLPILGVNVPWTATVQERIASLSLGASGTPQNLQSKQDTQLIAQSVEATLTAIAPTADSDALAQMPTFTLTLTSTETPTATSKPTSTSTPTVTPQPTSTPTPLPTDTPTPVAPHSTTNVNMRTGPGTEYNIVDVLHPEDTFAILARNEAGTWYQIDKGGTKAWVAAYLLEDAPPGEKIAVTTDIPTPPPPTSVSESAPDDSWAQFAGFPVQFGVTRTCGHFEYKVYDLRRVKSVWFYSREYIAQGEFLLLFVEVKNISSGTSYFGKFGPRLFFMTSDSQVRTMTGDVKASSYAGWMYQAGGFYEDINPGQILGLVEAYPLPAEGETPLFFAPIVCAETGNADDVLISLGWWSKVPRGHNTP